MPLAKGSSRRAVSQNIRTEMEAGMSQRQAVAVALHEARRTAKRKRIAKGGDLQGRNVVELNEVVAPGLPAWYEAVWHVKGHERARRREEGPMLGPVRRAFDRFVREVHAASGTSQRRGGGGAHAHARVHPTKPITIDKTKGGYTVAVYGVPVADDVAHGTIGFSEHPTGLYKMAKRPKYAPPDSPLHVFPKLDDAKHVAHQIGRYMMRLGDFVAAYTSLPDDRPWR